MFIYGDIIDVYIYKYSFIETSNYKYSVMGHEKVRKYNVKASMPKINGFSGYRVTDESSSTASGILTSTSANLRIDRRR